MSDFEDTTELKRRLRIGMAVSKANADKNTCYNALKAIGDPLVVAENIQALVDGAENFRDYLTENDELLIALKAIRGSH